MPSYPERENVGSGRRLADGSPAGHFQQINLLKYFAAEIFGNPQTFRNITPNT
jgi:hypothetical protein